ncbi:MAG: hypothetical protein ACREX4_25610, partial [Gammaproteobacteria bacterium]
YPREQLLLHLSTAMTHCRLTPPDRKNNPTKSDQFPIYTLTFGLRWEFAQNWLIAAEYHNIDGTGALSTVDNPEINLGGGDPHWDLFTLMLSFRF